MRRNLSVLTGAGAMNFGFHSRRERRGFQIDFGMIVSAGRVSTTQCCESYLALTSSISSFSGIQMNYNPSIAEKGLAGENALNHWLQQQGLPYVSICQNPENFSTLFPENVKRPDFLLLIPALGTIAIDAKNYTLSRGFFTLEYQAELLRSVAFERLFRIPVWYAYMDDSNGGQCWYWISALRAVEVGDVRFNSNRGVQFLAIPVGEFARVCVANDLAQLYHQNLRCVANVYGLPPNF